MYYTYMLRCADNSLYTGITTDIERRKKEHLSQSGKCAKYTRNHPAVRMEIVWESKNRSLASKLEYHIKTLSKTQKEALLKSKQLDIFFSDTLETEQYRVL